MQKILLFFSGLLLLVLTFLSLYFSGVLFETTEKQRIESFVFQPNNLSEDRIGNPVPIDKLSDNFIRDRLIKKFVYEYFYVVPAEKTTVKRTAADSIMAAMSSPSVFAEWKKNTATEISIMSDKKMLRQIKIEKGILPQGDYLTVFYELKTWEKSNDMNLIPKTENGILSLKISYDKGLRDTRGGKKFDVKKYIETGGAPAAIFKFRVDEVQKVIEK